MTYFKLNIPKLNEKITEYKSYKNKCVEDIDYTYLNLNNVETGWTDINSKQFLYRIKKDKYKIIDYFGYLDKLYEEIEYFKNNINDICYKYGYKTNTYRIEFNDDRLNDCINILEEIYSKLNDCLELIKLKDFDGFEKLNLIYELRTQILFMKDNITTIENNIKQISKSINNELSDSRNRINKIEKEVLDINLMNTTFKTVE